VKALNVNHFKGRQVAFAKDGWFNASQMASACGQDISEWINRPGMQDRMKKLARMNGAPGEKVSLYSRKRLHPGLWLHPCLADTLATWLDDDCHEWLRLAIGQMKHGGERLLKRRVLDRQYLLECFSYDGQFGLLIWKADRPASHFASPASYLRWRDQYAGDIAGWFTRLGYLQLSLDGVELWQHHVVLAMHDIQIPEKMDVDHINGVTSDNRIENLRVVGRSTNRRNSRINSNNTSGVNGVYVYSGARPYMVTGRVNGSMSYIGNYATLQEAAIARKDWERRIGGFTERHGREV